jgi:hypothetical protein
VRKHRRHRAAGCVVTAESRGWSWVCLRAQKVLAPEKAQLPISRPLASPEARVDRSVATLTVICRRHAHHVGGGAHTMSSVGRRGAWTQWGTAPFTSTTHQELHNGADEEGERVVNQHVQGEAKQG